MKRARTLIAIEITGPSAVILKAREELERATSKAIDSLVKTKDCKAHNVLFSTHTFGAVPSPDVPPWDLALASKTN